MTNSKERLEKAKKILYNETPADRIIDTYQTSSFIEFVCKAGGDTLTVRIYNDGTVTER